jgi:ABC-type nitrate/sulfonate/bicarbonate transport system substrate-binding protein
MTVPPGWPAEVPPPDAPEWERRAVGWLLDLCPPDYRSYDVLRRWPVLLARFATEHVEACRAAVAHGVANARPALRDLPPEVVEEAVAAYETEAARLAKAARAVELVAAALRGTRFRPRL